VVSLNYVIMDDTKWLKRRYPETFEEAYSFMKGFPISEFRSRKLKLGRLSEDVTTMGGQSYKEGDLIMFKRSNPITDFNYPLHYGTVKCKPGVTESGYHSFRIVEREFNEIHK
jgi:hypothetical protein